MKIRHVPSTGGAAVSEMTLVATSVDYTANADEFVEVDCTAGVVVITLPSGTEGDVVGVMKVDSSVNQVTISGTVEGVVDVALTSQYSVYWFLYTSTGWKVV